MRGIFTKRFDPASLTRYAALVILSVSLIVDHDGAWLFRVGLLLIAVVVSGRSAAFEVSIERARQAGYDAGYDDGRLTESSDYGPALPFRRSSKKLG